MDLWAGDNRTQNFTSQKVFVAVFILQVLFLRRVD
jgi:hypothetical protein